MNPLQYKTLELVGLDHGGNGRLCGIHSTNCGVAVNVGTKLVLRRATVDVQVLKKVPISTETPAVVDPPVKKRGRPKRTTVEYEERYVVESEAT